MGFFDKISHAVSSVVDDVVNVVDETVTEVIDAHDDVFDGVVDFVAENPELILQAGGAAFGLPPTGLLSSFMGGAKAPVSKQRSSQVVRRSVAAPRTAPVTASAQPTNSATPFGAGFFAENKNLLLFGGLGLAGLVALIFVTKK